MESLQIVIKNRVWEGGVVDRLHARRERNRQYHTCRKLMMILSLLAVIRTGPASVARLLSEYTDRCNSSPSLGDYCAADE